MVRKRHMESKHFYAVAYLALAKDYGTKATPCTPLEQERTNIAVARMGEIDEIDEIDDAELIREAKWLKQYIGEARKVCYTAPTDSDLGIAEQERAAQKKAMAVQQQEAAEEAAELTIECACCFGEYVFNKVGSILQSAHSLSNADAPSRWYNVLKRICFAWIAPEKMRRPSSACGRRWDLLTFGGVRAVDGRPADDLLHERRRLRFIFYPI